MTTERIDIPDSSQYESALDIIMGHYSGQDKNFTYPEDVLQKTMIIKVQIESLSGKKAGY